MANAIRLDASADRLDTETVVPSGASWTACGWVKISVDLNDETPLFTIEHIYGYPYIALRTDTDGVTPSLKYTWMSRCSLGAMTVGQWYFLGVRVKSDLSVSTWIGQAGGSLTRVDGTLPSGYDPAQSIRFSIGGGYTGAGYADGAFSRVRLWSAELTNADMDSEFAQNSGAARSAGLVGDWFRPDVTLGNYLTDNSGSSNTLTTTGTHALDTTAPDIVPSGSQATAAGTSDAAGVGTSILPGQAVASSAGASTSTGAGASVSEAVGSGAGVGAAPGVGRALGLDWSTAMPLISRGKPVFGTGVPGRMVDGGYCYVDDPGAWACTTGSWVAAQVGAGPTQVLVGLSADNTGGSCLANAFAAYRLQTSPDSTNGVDGTWTTRVTVTGNTVMAREHLLPFTGESWVKLILDDCAAAALDELDVWDATNGTPDTFALLGDSITDGWARRITFYGGGGNTPSFQSRVSVHRSGHFPLQVNCGATAQGAAFWETNIASFLSMHADVKYWLIAIGMNDGSSMPAGLATWRTRMTNIINAIVASGRIPIIARVTYTGAASYGGGDYDTCGLRYLNDNGVDWLVSTLGVRAGPDLYERFWLNKENFVVTTDPHPNANGYRNIAQAWADVVAPVIGATAAAAGVGAAAGATPASASTAAGSSSGVGAASAVGAALAPAAATSAGVATGPAVGAALVPAVGSAAGTGAAPGVGAALGRAVATSAGAGAAPGLGASTGAGVGSAPGVGAASAVGASGAAGAGASAGVGAASAVGTVGSSSSATATAAGVGAAGGVGASLAAALATASGAGVASGVLAALAPAAASAAGTATATGAGTSVTGAAGVGSSAGASTVAGEGTWLSGVAGASLGSSSAAGVGAALALVLGGSAGLGAAAGVSSSSATSAGVSTGTGAMAGVGAFAAEGVGAGSAAGWSSAIGVGASAQGSLGEAAGSSSIGGVGRAWRGEYANPGGGLSRWDGGGSPWSRSGVSV